jgi:hypothetical protein
MLAFGCLLPALPVSKTLHLKGSGYGANDRPAKRGLSMDHRSFIQIARLLSVTIVVTLTLSCDSTTHATRRSTAPAVGDALPFLDVSFDGAGDGRPVGRFTFLRAFQDGTAECDCESGPAVPPGGGPSPRNHLDDADFKKLLSLTSADEFRAAENDYSEGQGTDYDFAYTIRYRLGQGTKTIRVQNYYVGQHVEQPPAGVRELIDTCVRLHESLCEQLPENGDPL